MAYRVGGQSLRNSEQIGSKWFPASTLGVHVIREATLSADLTEVETRGLQAIVVAGRDEEVLRLTWEQASWLAATLKAAVEASRDLRRIGEEDFTPPASQATGERDG